MSDMMRGRMPAGRSGPMGQKTYKLLKTSWIYQTKEFFANSSLHGVRYIAEEGRPTIEKLMWFAFVLSGAIVTLIIIASLWEKFQTNPTITGLDTDFHSWDVPFPGISLCPSIPANASFVEDYVRRKWGKDLSQEKFETYSKFVSDIANLSYASLPSMAAYQQVTDLKKKADLKELLFDVVDRCEFLFKDCNWKDEPRDCCREFTPAFTENGFCYTFNSLHVERTWPWKAPEASVDTNVRYIYETDSKWAISFDSYDLGNNTIRVFIHAYDELPSVDMAPQHVWNKKVNSIHFASRTTYTTADAKQLSPKQRKCVFEDEIKLPTQPKYSYWACMTHCRMSFARSKCGCVPFFYQKADGFPYCDVEGLGCLSEYTNEFLTSMNCPCMLGCMNVVYEVEKVTDASSFSPEPLEIGFVSWPMIQYKREVLFGWVDLLVSFGGIAGLFLGFSLLSGVEVVYFFTLRACCMVYRQRPTLEKLQEEEGNIKTRDIDIGLVPKFLKPRDQGASGMAAMRRAPSAPQGNKNFNNFLIGAAGLGGGGGGGLGKGMGGVGGGVGIFGKGMGMGGGGLIGQPAMPARVPRGIRGMDEPLTHMAPPYPARNQDPFSRQVYPNMRYNRNVPMGNIPFLN